jgi:calcineurin-like phosphoesterase
MRGTFYKKEGKTIAIINIVGIVDGEIPFENRDDLIVQYDPDRGLLVMKESRKVKL